MFFKDSLDIPSRLLSGDWKNTLPLYDFSDQWLACSRGLPLASTLYSGESDSWRYHITSVTKSSSEGADKSQGSRAMLLTTASTCVITSERKPEMNDTNKEFRIHLKQKKKKKFPPLKILLVNKCEAWIFNFYFEEKGLSGKFPFKKKKIVYSKKH